MQNKQKLFFLIPVALLFLLPLVVMLLWNNVVITIFTVITINYWQAAGLFILSKLLFGGFGGRRPGFARQGLKEKWMNMSPEERQQMKDEWKKRMCRQ